MGFLLKYLKKYKAASIIGPLFKVIEVAFELLVPLVVASIIDSGIGGENKPYIVKMCFVMAGLAAVGLASTLIAQYYSAKAAIGVATDMRHDLFTKIQSFSAKQSEKFGTSALITSMTSDINQIQAGVNISLRLLLRSPFVVLGAMIMAFTVDVHAAIVFAVVIPLLFAVVLLCINSTIPMFRNVQKKLSDVTVIIRENITGTRVIRAFNNQETENKEFTAENENLSALQKLAGTISSIMNPATFFIINIAVIFLIKTGAVRVGMGLLTAGQVVALYNYMSQILVELIKFANVTVSLSKSLACAKRIEAVMVTDTRPVTVETPLFQQDKKVVFDNVCFSYTGGEDAIDGISFSAKPGETIGIIGGTGSGKTTVISLIPRFYDAKSGSVLIDGRDVRSYDIKNLREKIGFVPQKAALFTGTIRENILFGCENASDEELNEAIRVSQSQDVIASKRKGLEETVGSSGLSGGQRQRLTIARALVKKPEILILDDSASALDYATDKRLREAIKSLPWKPTVFIVSQRISAVMGCDKILLLDDGKQVGFAPHDELYRTSELYREICDIGLGVSK
ncbi:MAG: ABC transporter ATP-binding protein [Clostridia bacterium]|nr:ABC transporter ATP-binding protein [Clostridia bacterium]